MSLIVGGVVSIAGIAFSADATLNGFRLNPSLPAPDEASRTNESDRVKAHQRISRGEPPQSPTKFNSDPNPAAMPPSVFEG